MSELKPCIRCGGHMSWNDNEFESAYVCDDCHYFVEWDGTPEEFVKWWNTRPIEDELRKRITELEAYIDQLIEIGGWAITGMTIATSYSPGVMQDIAERKSDDWYALINNLKECDKEKECEE